LNLSAVGDIGFSSECFDLKPTKLPEVDFDHDGCSNKSQRSLNPNNASPANPALVVRTKDKFSDIKHIKSRESTSPKDCVPVKNPSSISIKTGVTSEMSALESQSITSKE